jgi:anti-sigma B factor antagonist
MPYESIKYRDIAVITVKLYIAAAEDAIEFNKYLHNLIEQGENKIIIDLTECNLVGSQFLGALVAAYKLVKANNGNIKLVYSPEDKTSILVLTRLNKVFEVFLTLEEAMDSWNKVPG